jgi:CheY-like chemotaxis protein
MRPPHVTSAIAFSPARLAGAAVLLGVVVLLAIVVSWRRSRAAGLAANEPLQRLSGFHIFGPDDEDDEPPVHVHVPVLRARPARSVAASVPAPARVAELGRIPPPPSAPGNGARPAVARTGMPAPRRPGPAGGHRATTASTRSAPAPARQPAPKPAAKPAPPHSTRAAAAPPPHTPRPSAKHPRASAPPPSPAPAPRRPAAQHWTTPRPAQARVDPAPAPRPRPKQQRRDDLPLAGDILLVEDDVTIATMYQMLLTARGYASRHALDGVEGMAMVRQERPALILLDMMMPRMDGLEFLEALRGWPKTDNIPVVVLSNVSDRHLVDRALDLGAVEYLVKAQTRPQVLIGALPHWLRGNRALTTLS